MDRSHSELHSTHVTFHTKVQQSCTRTESVTKQTVYAVLLFACGESKLGSSFAFNLLSFSINCFIMCLIIIACLCMYLAARMARKSWITSKHIPHIIFIFLPLIITNQIMASFCNITVISSCFKSFMTTISFIIAIKQYKKLLMVINWTIVDLKVSQNQCLLQKQIKMRKNFKRIFTVLWTGTSLIVIAEYIEVILFLLIVVLRNKTDTNNYISFCETSYYNRYEVEITITIVSWIRDTVGYTGILTIFMPYIGYGLSTMGLMLSRLCRGKTGYKTRFNSTNLSTPLIK